MENLTQISGRITGRRQHPTLDDYEVVTIELDRADAVPGKADLLGQFRGTTLDVSVRKALLGDANLGARLQCRAKRTFDGAMCEKDPRPGDFSIE
jgi:hypothetical protein